MSKPLRVSNLVKRFGRTTAVDDVSFEVAAGELFFLLGPSGCGKTTLLRSVAGFAEPDSGIILLGDRDISRLPPHRRNTAMVFQSYALWPHMTVLENVMFGLRMRRLGRSRSRRKAMETLEWVQLANLADRRPNQLSGGQQQRVALARAMAVDPDCLLLDEPLSNLDAKLRLEMRSEIQRIHRETSLTILYVTHDQKEALSLADRVALMRDGRIEQLGPPREMYRHPASQFAAGFLGEANFLDGTTAGADGELIQVTSAFGPLAGRSAAGHGAVAGGAACRVMVRPESLELHQADDSAVSSGGGESGGGGAGGAVNRIACRVESVTFLGEMEQIIVRTEAGNQALKLLEVSHGHLWRSGERALATFDSAAATVFTD